MSDPPPPPVATEIAVLGPFSAVDDASLPPFVTTDASLLPSLLPSNVKTATAPSSNARQRSSSVDRTRVHARRRIRVGVCARDKKAHSKPMKQVLSRFDASIFEVVIFGDDVLDKQPPDAWPTVDCLMSWYSAGFPLDKAEAYVKLRRPFCVNDLSAEHVLRDRRRFYATLRKHGIPTPFHVVLDRGAEVPPVVVELEDAIEVNGVRVNKPFVEKPLDAEDHNIYIYYPRRVGGGSKRLFRKVGNNSSRFYPDVNNVRSEGSYIYEEFLMTQGTDIKIYVVGPDYAHAEARKSPVVDGIVQRDEEGKEVRFPIMLTNKEKDIARRVCLAFRQNVCGFDLLRTPGASYVCDVNGWSFVKKSHKYYDDSSQVLQMMMLRAVAPERLHASILRHTSPPAGMYFPRVPAAAQAARAEVAALMRVRAFGAPRLQSPARGRGSGGLGVANSVDSNLDQASSSGAGVVGGMGSGAARGRDDSDMLLYDEDAAAMMERTASFAAGVGTPAVHEEELRCVAAVIRHGDRTPKQKMKMLVTHADFLGIHRRVAKGPREEAKLKSALQLQTLLEVTRSLLAQRTAPGYSSGTPDADAEQDHEDLEKLLQMKIVLEKGGHFSGINRKVQLKPTRWRTVPRRQRPAASPAVSALDSMHASTALHMALMGVPVKGMDASALMLTIPDGGPDPEATPLPSPAVPVSTAAPVAASLDVSTSSSADDTDEQEVVECLLVLKWGGVLTHAGRQQSEVLGQRFRSVMYPGESVGLLRLHSTYRHDLKIYSSDEGRVQMTAAAFVKGFLDLEGELTPILASLVKTVNTSNLLDDSDPARDVMSSLKKRLKRALTTSIEASLSGSMSDESDAGRSISAPATVSAGDSSVASLHSGEKMSSPPEAARTVASATDGSSPVKAADADAAAPAAQTSSPHTSAVSTAARHLSNVHLPDSEELAAIERELNSALVQAIAPTHAAALLKALQLIGPNPRATLHRVFVLIKSLVEQLAALLSDKQQRAESRRNSAALARALAAEARAAGSSDASLKWRAKLGGEAAESEGPATPTPVSMHADSDLARMIASQYREQSEEGTPSPAATGDASSPPALSPPDAAAGEASSSSSASPRERFESMDQCCSGETLWLMCERWKKLAKDLYAEKKDRFDLSKIPDVYDMIKHDCVHNGGLGLTGLQELYTLSKAFADVVVSQEYGISVHEKRDIAARIGHHLLRKIFFDMTAVAVEDPQDQQAGGTATAASSSAADAVRSTTAAAASRRRVSASAPHASSDTGGAAPAATPPTVAGTATTPHVFQPIPQPSESAAAPGAVPSDAGVHASPSAPSAPTPMVHPTGASSAAATLPSSHAFVSCVPGLIVTLRQHEFSAKVRRKSAPSYLTAGLHHHPVVVTEDIPHVNPAVGPYLGPDELVTARGLRTMPNQPPLFQAGSLVDWHGSQHRLVDFSLNRMVPRPVVSGMVRQHLMHPSSTPAASGSSSSSTSSTFHTGYAGHGHATAWRVRRPAPSASSTTATIAEDEAMEAGSVHTTTSSGAAAGVSFDRPAGGPVLVPGIRLRHRAAGLTPAAHTATDESPVAQSASTGDGPPHDTPTGMPSDSSRPASSGVPPLVPGTSSTPSPLRPLPAPSPAPVAATGAITAADGGASGADVQRSSPPMDVDAPSIMTASSGGLSTTTKMHTIMAAIAEDMQDVSETVHQLDARVIESQDAGYGEIKTPARHVRTRLYFTSESHVQALVNALKYWTLSPDVDTSRRESNSTAASNDGSRHESGQSRTVTSLLTPEALAMLEATAELDYCTHITFRLYENFAFPLGHVRRHRVEILFSPGAAFSPFDGAPLPPRKLPVWVPIPPTIPLLPTVDSGHSLCSPVTAAAIVREGRAESGSDAAALLHSQATRAARARAASPRTMLTKSSPNAHATERSDGHEGGGGRQSITGSEALPDAADGTGSVFFMDDYDTPFPDAEEGAGTATGPDFDAASVSSTRKALAVARNRALSRFSGPEVRPPTATVFQGPACASVEDRTRHTLPVAGVVPLHQALTLEEFEDVFADAIYYGVNLHLSEAVAKEQHPKDEMKARAAAAAQRARKSAADGYFLY